MATLSFQYCHVLVVESRNKYVSEREYDKIQCTSPAAVFRVCAVTAVYVY